MKIIIHGLGRMGSQIAQKISEEGSITLIAHNRSPEPIEEAATHGAVAAYTKQEALENFSNDEQVVLWLMLPSEIIDEQLNDWLNILPQNSIIIDGGNSDFRLTKQRSEKVKNSGSTLIDIGVSGGVWGYQNGFSMMVGCDQQQAFNNIEDSLKILALPEGAYEYFGPSGSGHFVKMTHNAIEYGMMQSLAEGYRLLKEGQYPNIDLKKASTVWQHHSVITSWLNQLVDEIMSENPTLDGIEGKVAQNGEAKWALEAAQELSIEMPAIEESLRVRYESENGKVNFSTKLLAAMRNKFGGHNLNN
jgi:6-phosphogluconate dehydrogenase